LADTANLPPLRLLAVIVLYRMKPLDSITETSLRRAMTAVGPRRMAIQPLFYDNTPGGQDPGILPENAIYVADRNTGGLAAAYNSAIRIARDNGFDWMLTLDQDTSLPEDFLVKIAEAIRKISNMPDVAAIVPQLSSDGLPLSPWTPTRHWALVRRLPAGFVGFPAGRVYATNSASTLRVSAVDALGGYDPRFRLDFSDLVMFHRLQNSGLRIYVAGDIRVDHELSGFDLKNRSSPARFADFHASEEAFYDEYLGTTCRLIHILRMSYRLLYRLWSQGGDYRYFRISFGFFCRKIFLARRSRRAQRERLYPQGAHEWMDRFCNRN
jgi:GT2 family glycosyltransferase